MYSREDTVKLLLNKKADPSTPGGVSRRLKKLEKFKNLKIVGDAMY